MNILVRWIKRWRAAKAVDKQETKKIQKENVYLPYIREILEQILEQKKLDYQHMRLLVIDEDIDQENVFDRYVKKDELFGSDEKKEPVPKRDEGIFAGYVEENELFGSDEKKEPVPKRDEGIFAGYVEEDTLFDTDRTNDVMITLEQLSPDLNFLIILTNRPAYFQEYVETMYEENGLPVGIEAKNIRQKFPVNVVLDFEQKGCFWNLGLPEESIYLPIYKKSWEKAGNLDIFVPIGYNTVIVKGFPAIEKRGRVL